MPHEYQASLGDDVRVVVVAVSENVASCCSEWVYESESENESALCVSGRGRDD
jgi:hypothetical protein